MTEVEYWPSLAAAWKESETCEVVSLSTAIHSSAPAKKDWQLIKSESRARLLLLETHPSQRRIICKIYRVPPQLSWRTVGMVSRANREFTALMKAHRAGLPVVCPFGWSEERRFGCVTYSAIQMELVTGRNLEEVLRDRNTDAGERINQARETGKLLSTLHSGGLFWATAVPRNILVRDTSGERLQVIDTPYAQLQGRDITGSKMALADLCSIVRSRHFDWGFDRQEQLEMLLAYCGNDERTAAGLNSLVAPPSRFQSKLARLRNRSANVLLSGPRSAGSGGRYKVSNKSYYKTDGQLEFFSE